MKNIFTECNLSSIYESKNSFHLHQTILNIKEILKSRQKEFLSLECAQKPKLRTFVLFKDFQEQPAYITKPLSFYQRRMIAKTRLGCLPIRLETGRYSIPRLPENERKCLVCKNRNQLIVINPTNDPVESENHYLFDCSAYKAERELWYSKMTLPPDFDVLPLESKLKVVLNEPYNVKLTSLFITNSFNIRSRILK